jgi:hypothetical protein
MRAGYWSRLSEINEWGGKLTKKSKMDGVTDSSASSDDSGSPSHSIAVRSQDSQQPESPYSGIDSPLDWSYRRWAWEFLIRNKEFITACKDVTSGSSDQRKEVASRFGLKKFKAFDEPYEKDKNDKKKDIRKPKFKHYAIRSWSNMNGDKHRENVPFKITLSKNQVLILFDLNSISVRKGGLKRQLKLTEERLQNRLNSLQILHIDAPQRNVAVDSLTTNIPNAKNYLRHLKILEAYDPHKPIHEYAKIIFPLQTKDKAEARDDIKKMVKTALKNSSEDYRVIAAWGGKPEGKNTVYKD